MRLGVSLVDPAAPFEEVARVAQLADELGFHTVWTTESVAREALLTLTHWASRTRSAVLATGVCPIALRPPVFAAMAAATMAEAAPGRFWFGIGSGSPMLAARWFGLDLPSPLTAVREYATIVRKLLAGEEVIHRGRAYRVEGARLQTRPPQPVPVLVAALGAKMTRVAGEAADGVLFNWNSVEGLRAAGAAVAGVRGPEPFITATYVRVAVSADPEAALQTLRREFAGYLRVPAYRAQLEARGFPEVAARVAVAWERGDPAAAARAIPPETALSFGVAGDPEACLEALAAYSQSGIEHVVVRPVPVGAGGLEPAVRMAAGLL